MKRMLKSRRRPSTQKNGLTPKRRWFKRIKNCSKKRFYPINAPHNTSDYLIKNNSSPFYEDDDIEIIPSSLIILEDSEELFDEDSNYQRKISSAFTQGETIGIDSHIGKQTSIFSLK